jgi:ribosomal protein L11 methyltransferase
MPWLQLHLTTDREKAPLVELLFENLGALSVTLRDAADEPLLEPAPGESPLWQRTRVTALFPGNADGDLLRGEIARQLIMDVDRDLQLERLEEQVWERAWMDEFHPMRFGQRLWVCPDGRQPQANDAVVVQLDPGLAFGTGTHPTTSLCLQWLDSAGLQDKTLLDFGCGSGILSVAALKLGAARVTAIDHDPQALEATRRNAEKNRVSDRLQVYDNSRLPRDRYDMVLANILAGTLIELEPEIAAHTMRGGSIALSGILIEQTTEVRKAYAGDFQIAPPTVLGDWVLLQGRRR